jgi:hypothetical protein
MKSVVLLICLFMMHAHLHAQQRWVQMFVDGLESEQDARLLENHFYQMEGIANVRAESAHGNLLIFIKENFVYTEEELRLRVEQSGLNAWCYRTGIAGIDIVTRISRSSCEPLQEQK